MKITKLYAGDDGESHFGEVAVNFSVIKELGQYSLPFPVRTMRFRAFGPDHFFDWHNAPEPQYIIYLEGEVSVEIGSGEKRIFKPGEVLFATDLKGRGHCSRTLSAGKSIIVTTLSEEHNTI